MSLELSPHVHKEGKNVFKPVTFFFLLWEKSCPCVPILCSCKKGSFISFEKIDHTHSPIPIHTHTHTPSTSECLPSSSLSITADHCDSQRLLAGPRVFTSQNWQTPASECSVTEMKTETPILLWAKKKKLQKCAWRLKMQCPNQNAVWGLWAYLLSEVADEAKYHTYTHTYNKQGHLYFIHNWTLIKSQLFIGIYQANHSKSTGEVHRNSCFQF